MIGANFRCGHPRLPGNSTRGYLHANGRRYPTCALCKRAKRIAAQVDHQLLLWKSGKPTPREERLRRIG